MLASDHRIHIADSCSLEFMDSDSVALVVTSPPYPMIEMWDNLFRQRNPGVSEALSAADGRTAFELMHKALDRVWAEVHRVLHDGGFACINIGDATRKIGDRFQLFPNHSRILLECHKLGFDVLPVVLWRKQTNAPNKFMGSGMLPAGAYVTLEHEYILVLRKGPKRRFKSEDEKSNRRNSAIFWEERNRWFSDIWDFKGTRQALNSRDTRTPKTRTRSAAFPFELAYRLICMYSAKSDIVLDPFLGTGTAMFAAMASGRNSVGVDLEAAFLPVLRDKLIRFSKMVNSYTADRLQRHLNFCRLREQEKKKKLKYVNLNHQFQVMTAQEVELKIEAVESITAVDDLNFRVTYAALGKDDFLPQLRGFQDTITQDQLSLAF